MATIGQENGGESGNTSHPTQLNPKKCEPLDGKMGSIYGSYWSPLATPNDEAYRQVLALR